MKSLLFALLGATLLLVGCGDTDAKATKSEENGYRNPSKNPPPEASNMAPQVPKGEAGPGSAPAAGK